MQSLMYYWRQRNKLCLADFHSLLSLCRPPEGSLTDVSIVCGIEPGTRPTPHLTISAEALRVLGAAPRPIIPRTGMD
jgi:hypothetical protein